MPNQPKKNKKLSALVRRILLALLGLALGVNAYLANANHVLGNKLPMPFGYGAGVVLSGSMEPTFSKDDLIFVKKTDDVSVGDIVVYQSGNELIVHRIISINGDMVMTQGDANNVPDSVFEKSSIKGVVTGWIPYIGVIVNILKTPAGTVLVLVCAFLLIDLSFRKQKDEDNKRLDAIKEEIRKLKEEMEKEE